MRYAFIGGTEGMRPGSQHAVEVVKVEVPKEGGEPTIHLRLIEEGRPSVNVLLGMIRAQEFLAAFKDLDRSHWQSARHIIRYAYQDLQELFGHLEVVKPGWQAGTLLEIDRVIASLRALRKYLAGSDPDDTE